MSHPVHPKRLGKPGVYRIVCERNGRAYIGSTSDLVGRFCNHRSMLGRGVHTNRKLQKDWDRYGDDQFDFQILTEAPASLLECEQDWLDRGGHLYNIVMDAGAAPMLGRKHSEKTRARWSRKRKGQGIGRKHRPETIEKMRQIALKRTDMAAIAAKGNRLRAERRRANVAP